MPLTNKGKFTRKAIGRLQKLYDLVNSQIEKRGDKADDCQQCHLLNCLFDVEKAINGVEVSDMKALET